MIACVRILNFALRLYLLERPEHDGEPLVLTPGQGERRKVIDCTPEATALYIRPGMSIRDVISMSPTAIVVESNPAREAAASQDLLRDLENLSPLVEADPTEAGCWYIDLHGLERLFGPMQTFGQRLLQMMPPLLRPRVGIAGSKFTARVVAGSCAPGNASIVDPADSRAFLAQAPITTLPLSPALTQLLRQMGLDRLGQLADLPASAVAARLGPEGKRAWTFARGEDSAPIQAAPPQERVLETLELPAPTASRDALLFALRLLVQRASLHPAMRARGARQVLVRALYEDGGSWEKPIAMKEPAHGDQLGNLLVSRFRDLELPQPVAVLQIELSNLSHESARQDKLTGFRPRHEVPLNEVNQQLNNRYRTSSLFRVVGVEPWSRLPERRYALMPYEPQPADTPKSLNMPQEIEIDVQQSARQKLEPAALITGKRRQLVEQIADRWCINESWWLRPIRRRYFQIMLKDGAMRTIFHDSGSQQWFAQEY